MIHTKHPSFQSHLTSNHSIMLLLRAVILSFLDATAESSITVELADILSGFPVSWSIERSEVALALLTPKVDCRRLDKNGSDLFGASMSEASPSSCADPLRGAEDCRLENLEATVFSTLAGWVAAAIDPGGDPVNSYISILFVAFGATVSLSPVFSFAAALTFLVSARSAAIAVADPGRADSISTWLKSDSRRRLWVIMALGSDSETGALLLKGLFSTAVDAAMGICFHASSTSDSGLIADPISASDFMRFSRTGLSSFPTASTRSLVGLRILSLKFGSA